MKKVIILLIASFCFMNSAFAQSFKDIPQSYSGYNAIEWAVEKKIIGGYTDNTFRKSDALLESQFLAVFSRYFNPTIDQRPKGPHWFSNYYIYLTENGLTVPGNKDKTNQTKPVTRGTFALLLAQSQDPSIKDQRAAINWLYEQGITRGFGQSSDPFIDFRPQSFLERGQVASFFMRLNDKGFTMISKGANVPVTKLKGVELQNKLLPKWKADGYTIQDGPLAGVYIVRDDTNWRFDIQMNDQTTSLRVTDTEDKSVDKAYEIFHAVFPELNELEFKEKLMQAWERQDQALVIGDANLKLEYRNPTPAFVSRTITYYYK